jgi:SAM-dependent methyltransferase
MKINLGAGHDIRAGWVNTDLSPLPGIDVVHDLNRYPWPWADDSADEIIARDLLEHLDDFLKAMEELHRVLRPGGIARIKVPYWNAWCRWADPTHKRGFHELTFQFFDPNSHFCRERHYYTNARFHIREETFVLAPFTPYFGIPGLRDCRVSSRWGRRIVGFFGNLFSNIILDLDIVMQKAQPR